MYPNNSLGKDLRAAAALARLQQSNVPIPEEKEVDMESETDDESDFDATSAGQDQAEAVDTHKIRDSKGRELVNVCGDGEMQSEDAQKEMEELGLKIEEQLHEGQTSMTEVTGAEQRNFENDIVISHGRKVTIMKESSPENSGLPAPTTGIESDCEQACPICSLHNGSDSLTCAACAHVLHPEHLPNHWVCQSVGCRHVNYINSGDSAICGLCGQSRV